MNPAIAALLDRLDPKAKSLLRAQAGRFDDALARRLAMSLIERGRAPERPGYDLLASVIALHGRELDGETVGAAEWRGVRKQAIALSAMTDISSKRAGALAEAGAWSMAGSRSGLGDIVTALGPLAHEIVIAQTGWTREDEARAHAVMKKIASDNEALDRTQMPALFAAAEPELERRFRAQLDAANKAYLAFSASILDELARLAEASLIPQ